MLHDLERDQEQEGHPIKKNQSVAITKMQDLSDDEEKVEVFSGTTPGGKKNMNMFNCLVIT